MWKKILLSLVAILSVFIVIAALKPEDYVIKRDLLINAKPEVIFPYLVNAKNADSWMPWKEIDPAVKNAYSGPDEGVGSISSWDSPGQMGTGKAEIISVTPNQSVKTRITYTRPMEMEQNSEFTLSVEGEQTRITWTVTGKQPFIPRLMCTIMFMNMDQFVGGMFEKGLHQLKNIIADKK